MVFARRLLAGCAALVALTSCSTPAPDDGPSGQQTGQQTGQPAGQPDLDATAFAAPAGGAYFGNHFSATVDRRASLAGLEEDLGRQVALDHTYHRFDTAFPDAYDRWTLDQGRSLFLSWSCRLDGSGAVDFRDVVDGEWDEVIDARARDVAALGEPVLLSFCHEPDGYLGADKSGTEEDYIAAWRYLSDRFEAAGARNVSWVWTLTSYAFREGDPDSLYPGDDVVDWVGVDGYVNIGCPWLNVGWASWTDTFGVAADFAASHDKPLTVAEFSLREDPADPQRKREWLAQAVPEIQAMPNLRAVVGFNSVEPCSDAVASTPEAVAGLRELSTSDYLSVTPPG